VVRALLADMVDRGLCFGDGLLVVLDGAKALSAAVREVFGDNALVRRCTCTSGAMSPITCRTRSRRGWTPSWSRRSPHPDPERGLRRAKDLAGLLAKSYPGAAASLLEGLDEMSPSPVSASTVGWQDADHVEPGRIDDLDRPLDQPQRHPLARRVDGAALDRRGHAQRRAILPPHQGLQADAPARRRATPTRSPQHRPERRNRPCRRLTGPRIATENPRRSGHAPLPLCGIVYQPPPFPYEVAGAPR
jgi:hypothetical protein